MNDNKSPAFLISSTGTISLFLNGKANNVDPSHQNYEAIKTALREKKYDAITPLLDVAKPVREAVAKFCDSKDLRFENGTVTYMGEAVHNSVVDMIVEFAREDFDFAPLMKFLDNLLLNPSKASVDNLYRFIEVNKMPITEDGCFLAYKYVSNDYKDCHTGKFDNSVGKVVKMLRNQVQDDPTITCSYGLHVAALEYANGHGSTVVVCKVNPKDVVSVPTDYMNQKMRVCEYEVIADFTSEIKQEDCVNRRFNDDVEVGGSGYGIDEDEDNWNNNE